MTLPYQMLSEISDKDMFMKNKVKILQLLVTNKILRELVLV